MKSAPTPAAARRHTGLGAWLALAFVLMSVTITVLLTLLAERMVGEQVRESIGSNLAELAHQTTSRLDRGMFERYREVQLMAARLNDAGDAAAVRRELQALQDSYPLYAWIGLTDASGRVRVATGAMLEREDVSGRPWFQGALQGRHLGDVHDAVLLAHPLAPSKATPPHFVDIAFAQRTRDGALRGVLGAHLSWEWARDIERVIFEPLNRQRATEALIVARDGTVLLGPPGLQGTRLDLPSLRSAARGAKGHVTEAWPDGQTYLVGHSADAGWSEYPGMGWRVLVRQNIEQAYTPVRQMQREVFVYGLIAALVFSVLGWLAARAIARPLRALTDAARALEAGHPVRVPQSTGYEEVSMLGRALNAMVHRLQTNEIELRELNASLERRVTERTAALSDAFERVKTNERRIEALVDMAQDPFVAVDFAGRITDWNAAAEQLLGYRSEEVIGREMVDVMIPSRYRAVVRAAFKRFLVQRSAPFVGQRLERLITDRQGREIPVELRVSLIDAPPVQLFSAFLHDIRERKEVERLKDEFVSTVSHELRTPLTAMYGSLNLLASGMAGDLSPDAKELVQLANDSCERLIRLINDLLDVEKMAAGSMSYDMRRQPIEALVVRAVRDTQAYADGFGVALRLLSGADAMVNADSDRIVQVVVNLLANAVKFSPRGGVVDVSLQVRAGQVRVSVTDQGPGIPEAFKGRIFERFEQADASDRRQKSGTGLGLAICRSIVQAHGGHIAFDSRPGHTEFFFELPLA